MKRHAIIILMVILMTGMIFAGCDSEVSPTTTEQSQNTTTNTPAHQSSLISVQELHEILSAANQIKLVDIRATSYYTRGYIEGAISIPLAELPERLGELSTDEALVVYANCG